MTDKQPYLVTIILGVLAWLVTHIVDGVVAAPTLEYRFASEVRSNRQALAVELRNVTRSKRFDAIRVRINVPGGRMLGAEVIPVQPGYEGDEAPSANGTTAIFTLPHVMPGEAFTLHAEAEGLATPRLRLTTEGQAPVRFVRANLETFSARHEIAILSALFVVWAALLGLVALRLRRGVDSPD